MIQTWMDHHVQTYFSTLHNNLATCYSIAQTARKKGYDPVTRVEVALAKDLAERVEELVGPPGIAQRLRELSKSKGREEVAISIAREIVKKKVTENPQQLIEQAIRTGLAVLTEGVLVAPLAGISTVELGTNQDGGKYVDLYFSGPIRSAGGTGQAMSVLIADIVRRELGLEAYKPTPDEIERCKEELPLYNQIHHLQYSPTPQEIELIVGSCPISINGEGTEDREITGKRNLSRIKTNRIRGGACLVIAEGLCLKAPKLQKHVSKLKLQGWEFLQHFLSLKKDVAEPTIKYIQDLIAGRPVFAHPSRKGGFRLRYGRARTAGLAATALNPATMYLLDNFIAIGTQLKVQGPGKGTVGTPCDSIEGTLLLLNNNNLVQVNTLQEAKNIRNQVKEIIDVGEILIPFGEFAENNANLLPSSYCYEWWIQDLQEALKYPIKNTTPEEMAKAKKKMEEKLSSELEHNINLEKPSPQDAFKISEKYKIPLHPYYNLFWHDLSIPEIEELGIHIQKSCYNGNLVLPLESKEILTKLGAVHIENNGLIIDRYSYPLLRCCGYDLKDNQIIRTGRQNKTKQSKDTLELITELSGVKIMPRAPSRIGARMGRPEKAAPRKMKASPHLLFPVGNAGGRERNLRDAAKKGQLTIELGLRECEQCGKLTYTNRCSCGGHTQSIGKTEKKKMYLGKEIERAQKNLNLPSLPDKIKGVRGMSSKTKTPEFLEKGLLRARHDIWVFKDGTTRFDMTNLPLTHFRPSEIGVDIHRLQSLGYSYDWQGKPLQNSDQIVELNCQDVIPSKKCGEYLLHTAQFIDDLLTQVYGLDKFYNVDDITDLIGHLAVGLSPHTSAGALARIIGFSPVEACWAHPFYHAAKRRNCDGDEDALMLLMDVLLNFSREYIPDSKGGEMDLPLILTTQISPSEVDKEVQNIDVLSHYPLKFYQETMHQGHPKDMESIMDLVAGRIATKREYASFGFTHDTTDIAHAPKISAYKTLKTMKDKVDAQLKLAKKIRAVDEADVAQRVLKTHFLPDIIGNLNAFSCQAVRCPRCNKTYRRIPLQSKCIMCGGKLTLTVHEGSVRKYMDMVNNIVAHYPVSEYTKQRIVIVEKTLSSLFINEKVKITKIEEFT